MITCIFFVQKQRVVAVTATPTVLVTGIQKAFVSKRSLRHAAVFFSRRSLRTRSKQRRAFVVSSLFYAPPIHWVSDVYMIL